MRLPGKQQMVAQVFGFLPAYTGGIGGAPASWLQPGPALDAVDMWEMSQRMEEAPPAHCLHFTVLF